MGESNSNENLPTVTEAVAENDTSELDKYWSAVHSNPNDFTGWTYLLQYVEQENKLETARPAFDEFLEKYPYCFGYWKKYADLEKRHGNNEKAEEVFERGVQAIPLAIDLWLHYIAYVSSQYESDPKLEARMRKLFERAITASGTDFRSDRLWDTYISWETEHKLLKNVTALYDRVLAIPTQSYRHHYEQFCNHARAHSPKDILSVDEFLRLRSEVVASRDKVENNTEEDDDMIAPPGADEAPPGVEEEVKTEDPLELASVREKLIEIREGIHRANEEEVRKRWSYEQGIRRPYFHVKPLEKAQLKAWKEYLDFEIENGTHERSVVLFERCMVACALYDEFWIKYARYMEAHSKEAVRNIYKRACTIHLTHKPSVYMAWAMFEEREGNYDGAKAVLKSLEEKVPGLVMTAMKLINMERRQGHFTEARAMYKDKLDCTQKVEERSFYAIKYARYLAKVSGDINAALEVLSDALDKDTTNHRLYLQLIDLEYQRIPINETALLALFDKAINSPLSAEHRASFSQRRLEFIEEFSATANRMQDVFDEHQKLVKDAQATRKRKTSTSDASELQSDSTGKKAKSDQSDDYSSGLANTKSNAKVAPSANAKAAKSAASSSQATSSYTAPPPPPPPPPSAAAAVPDASYSAQYMNYWPGYGYGSYAQYQQYQQYQQHAWASYNALHQDYYHR